jgi:AcrR family transcriptional regulator
VTVEEKPRWRRRKDARPEEIVAAALELFATHGFAATRLDDIARRAGVSKGTLYLYFPSKEELFKAVVREALLPNLAKAETRLKDAKGPTARVLEEILGGLAHVVATTRLGAIPKLVIAEAGNFPGLAKFYVNAVPARGFAMFQRLIERGIKSGEFRPVDAAAVAPIFAAPVLMMALWKHVLEPHLEPGGGPKIEPRRFIDGCIDVLLNGLRKRPGNGGGKEIRQ